MTIRTCLLAATIIGGAVSAQAEAYEPLNDGAPSLELGGGLSIKPRGRVLFDVGNVENPDGVSGIMLGWQDEFRTARAGVEVEHGDGHKLTVELDFADDYPVFKDAKLGLKLGGGVSAVLGQHKTWESLEELTSGRFTSFLERASFTDAFGFDRRVGASLEYKTDTLLLQGGVFTDNIDDFSDQDDTPLVFSGRVTVVPIDGEEGILHLGASATHREYNGDPGDQVRYRQRPQFHATDTRLVNTGRFDVDSDFGFGVESAFVGGPLHIHSEAYWLSTSNDAGGPEAGFFGAFVEAGWFLTGETRTYKIGKFDRTKPKAPVGAGGFGAVQLNLRFDHLDLTDGTIVGGTQDSYLASLVWIPTNRTRVVLNGGWLDFNNATIANAAGSRDYDLGMVALRTQFDF